MNDLWDIKADCIEKGDNLRDIIPIPDKIKTDKAGFTHYVFKKTMFRNPKFTIPEDDYELFKKFLDGGSREYPSDGNLPTDIAANEAQIILDKIEEIANDPTHKYHKIAKETLKKKSKIGLVRGTIKLYLGNFTTRDWRRKRFTDDIDFWVFNKSLLEYVLKETGWNKNTKTREFEKLIDWVNFETSEVEHTLLIASNDVDQVLDFGLGSYLDGSALKDILKKKILRGHDVDLSDIINVAIVNNKAEGKLDDDWADIWDVFEESANTRNTRITSNMISLCRYSYGIADYLERVGKAIIKYNKTVLEKTSYSDKKIVRLCKTSSHYLTYNLPIEPSATRNRIYNNLIAQKRKKLQYSKNLRDFANRVLKILNSKYSCHNVIFEIEK